MVDVNRLFVLNCQFVRELQFLEEASVFGEEHVADVAELKNFSSEMRIILDKINLPILPLFHGIDYELLGCCFVHGEELYNSPSGELNIDNDVVPSDMNTPEYTKWLARAITIVKNKFPTAKMVTVWNDAGYRVYSDTEPFSIHEDVGMWTYKLLQ